MDTGPAYRRLIGGYLAASLIAIFVHASLGADARTVSYFVISATALPAMYHGVRHCLPVGRPTGWLLFTALVVLTLGNFSAAAGTLGLGGSDRLTEAVLTLGNLTLLVSALRFVRLRGRNDAGGLLDVAVVSVAGGGLVWTTVLQPRLDDLDVAVGAQAGLLFNVLVLTGVLGALLRLELTAGERIPALRFIIVALVLTLAGNLTLIALNGSVEVSSVLPVEIVFLSSYALVGAAGLHPSLHRLAVPGPRLEDRLGLDRLIFLGAALAVPTVAGAGRQLFGLSVDGLLLATNTLISVPLVMVRVGYLSNQRMRAEDKLVRQATHDALTGLTNRAEFLHRLEKALARRGSGGHLDVLLLFCDLDGFKTVNDRLGHTVGDELLISVARRLARTVAKDDTLARYGGDEFLIMCETANPLGARASVSRRVVAALSDPFDLAGERITIGVSIGAVVAESNDSADTLITRADTAMYAAKQRHHIPRQADRRAR